MVRLADAPRQSLELGAGTRIWGIDTKVSLNPGLLPGAIQKTSLSWADPLLAGTHPARAAVDVGRGFGDPHRFWSRLSSLRLSMPRAVNPSVARSSVS